MSVNIGDKAPDFTLPTDGNGTVTLSALRGKPVVLYFYPKDDTSGCTAQACGFRDTFPDYGKTGATVIGMSRDSVASHDKFKKKYELPFTLASDNEGKVTEAYGVWVEKSMYGRKYMGIDRSTFVIDKEGVVRGVWHKVKVAGHVADVLKTVQALWILTASSNFASLAEGAASVLAAAEPPRKVALSRAVAARWRAGGLPRGAAVAPPRPSRPVHPELRPPRDMPKRRNFGSLPGRIALLHALAHIELNAIDLAWDVVVRFGDSELPRGFCDDWLGVATEEAEHFSLLSARLEALGSHYGALPAHDGLWEAAAVTAHDLLARLAVVPLVLEARGLDVTPEMRLRLERAGDGESAAILDVIYRDEIGHVAVGARWFDRLCRERGLDPPAVYHDRVRRHFTGLLKPPFNHAARARAGLPAAYYEPLAARVREPPCAAD